MFKMIIQKTKLIFYNSLFYTFPLILTFNIFENIKNNNFSKKNIKEERMHHLMNY
jgi:hypothetical protein